MKPILIAYFGSPNFSALLLEKLLTAPSLRKLIKIKLVVTQPDKPVGRKQVLTPTPVKRVAQKYKIKVINQLTNRAIGGAKRGAPSSAQSQRALGGAVKQQNLSLDSEIRNCDLALVFAYKNIIPQEILALPKYGFFNIHPSLLPKYRGPSPIAYPLIRGDATTGVTIIKMDEKIDHGPIISQQPIAISPFDRRPDLENKLTLLAYQMVRKIIITAVKTPSIITQLRPPQNHSQATYTHLLHRQDGFIPLSTLKKSIKNQPLDHQELPLLIRDGKLEIKNSAKIVFDYFRGLYPWPGIWTKIKIKGEGKRLKILDFAMKNNQLIIKKVQLEGKHAVGWQIFTRAYRI